jgi:hypothetical protein
MSSPIACMMCAVDPAMTSLMLPLAQATIISAPILLRGRIRRGIQRVRAGRQGSAAAIGSDGSDKAPEPRDQRPEQ